MVTYKCTDDSCHRCSDAAKMMEGVRVRRGAQGDKKKEGEERENGDSRD